MSVSLATIGGLLGKSSNVSLVDASSALGSDGAASGQGDPTIHTRTKASSGYRRVNPFYSGSSLSSQNYPDMTGSHHLLEFHGYAHVAVPEATTTGTFAPGYDLDVTAVGPGKVTITWNNPSIIDDFGNQGDPATIVQRIVYKDVTSETDDTSPGTYNPFSSATIAMADQPASTTSKEIQFGVNDGGKHMLIGVHYIFQDADDITGTAGTGKTANPAIKYGDQQGNIPASNGIPGHLAKSTLTSHTPAVVKNDNGSDPSNGVRCTVMPLIPTIPPTGVANALTQVTDSGGGTSVNCEETNQSVSNAPPGCSQCDPEEDIEPCTPEDAYLKIRWSREGFTSKTVDVIYGPNATRTNGANTRVNNISGEQTVRNLGQLANAGSMPYYYVWVKWSDATDTESSWDGGSNSEKLQVCCLLSGL